MRVAVIGGTGNAGRLITRLLLEDPSAEVNACARSEARLHELETTLAPHPGSLHTTVVDVERERDLVEVASSTDLVVGATSLVEHGPGLASLAVDCGASYIGVYLSDRGKWSRLRRLQGRCVERGLMVVDDGGCHPGLPAVMIRLAAEDGGLEAAWVGAKFRLRWDELGVVGETIQDFLAEVERTDPSVFVDRAWVRGFRHSRSFDFGRGEGPESCVPMCIEEIRELAESGEVDSAGFFMAGFGPVMDYGILPASIGLAKLNRRLATILFWWGLRRLASAAERAVLLLDGTRRSDGSPVRIRVSHLDPYLLTAAPVVATIRQMIAAPRPGVWTQAAFVDPTGLFRAIREMGVSVEA